MSANRRAVALFLVAATLLLHRPAPSSGRAAAQASAATPIQYLVVIDEEGASFDHYFGNYPVAANLPGEPHFAGIGVTPAVDGLTAALITNNPNAAQPFRLDRSQALTCSASSRYDDEQRAYDGGNLDRFVESVARPPVDASMYCPQDAAGGYTVVMGTFDGNSVTALWNYAQQFALSDNYFATTFGQASLGALHMIAGDSDGVVCGPQASVYGNQPPCGREGQAPPESTEDAPASNGSTGTLLFGAAPLWDTCAAPDAAGRVAISGLTIGDLLDGAGVTWGWFQGGFAVSSYGACDSAGVQTAYDTATGVDPTTDSNLIAGYDATVEPFQFFASTANPEHLSPGDVSQVGHDDEANHQYDLSWFWQAAAAGDLPSVSFLKPPPVQAGRAGESNPLDQQQFLVDTVNRLQQLPQWAHMAVIVTWDDSGGWYDHVAPRRINQSDTPFDSECGDTSTGDSGRCGYGPRLPILAISPYAKHNYISHALIDQTSIARFIEDNWLGGQRLRSGSFDSIAGSLLDLFNFNQPPLPPLPLDPATGEPAG